MRIQETLLSSHVGNLIGHFSLQAEQHSLSGLIEGGEEGEGGNEATEIYNLGLVTALSMRYEH